jgi:hypothetical protein
MAAYELTDDENVAFVAALLGGVRWGPIQEEDGYYRQLGWCLGDRAVDREIRALMAADVIAYVKHPGMDLTGKPVITPGTYMKFARGKRAIDESKYKDDAL